MSAYGTRDLYNFVITVSLYGNRIERNRILMRMLWKFCRVDDNGDMETRMAKI